MQLPETAGVMILGGASLFPGAHLPLHIFEPRYRRMLSDALEGHRLFVVAMQRPGDHRETPLPVAGIGIIRAAVRTANGTSNLVLQGVARVRLGAVARYRPYRLQRITPVVDAEPGGPVVEGLRRRVLDLVDARLHHGAPVSAELLRQLATSMGCSLDRPEDCLRALRRIGEPGRFADLVALLLLNNPLARQLILQTLDVAERLRRLVHLLGTQAPLGDSDKGTPGTGISP